jgi:8-oxo-dGTP diphosphatase
MKRRFCNFCGRPLGRCEVEGRQRLVCCGCGQVHYENPLPVASILVPNEEHEVLLVRRRQQPYQGMWCLPIGFAELGESIEEAALRELREEAGIDAEIVRLLDVSSLHEPAYGDLLIVTFEGRKTGGEEQPGDDADEARYFAVSNLPKLAFEPQVRAVQRYLQAHAEEWAIRSSMEAFVLNTSTALPVESLPLESDDLTRYVAASPEPIIELWLEDVVSHPTTSHYHAIDRDELRLRADFVLAHFGKWLPGGRAPGDFQADFRNLGRTRRTEGIPLSEVLSSFSLLKKHIWMYHVSRGFWERAIDIYRVLELDKRVTFFFDYVAYQVTRGYEEKEPRE